MKEVVLASNNAGKLKEFRELFSHVELEIHPQTEFNVPEVEETGTTFIENAIIKARHAAKQTGLPALGDDSGLEVVALSGAPGIYSARYAGADASSKERNNKLLDAMRDVPKKKRQARFCCALVYMRHADDASPIIAQAFCPGLIADKPRGRNGFGYDPIVFLPDCNCTMAELAPTIKNNISHRGRALHLLLTQLKGAVLCER